MVVLDVAADPMTHSSLRVSTLQFCLLQVKWEAKTMVAVPGKYLSNLRAVLKAMNSNQGVSCFLAVFPSFYLIVDVGLLSNYQ